MLRVHITLAGEQGEVVEEGVTMVGFRDPFVVLYSSYPVEDSAPDILAMYHQDTILKLKPVTVEDPRIVLATAVPPLQVPDRMKT